MATRAENLQTALNQIALRIAEVTAEKKPSYSVDGESVSWETYLATLIDKQEALEKALARASGPFEVRSRGLT